jgi:hypothetical protein
MDTKRPACAGLRKIVRQIFNASSRGYFIGLQAFLALHHLEAHFLPFFQALEARTGNRTKMHEYVRAIFTTNEAEALGVVEPFDCAYFTIRHDSLRPFDSSIETSRPARTDGLLGMLRIGWSEADYPIHIGART